MNTEPNAQDAHMVVTRIQRQGSGLMGALQAGTDAGLNPSALASLVGLKVATVRALLFEWNIS